MNILFDINHPAHVHLFRNAVKILKSQGHEITITAREKDVTRQLLDAYNLPYTVLSKAQSGLVRLGVELLCRQIKLFSIIRKNNIHVCVSVTGACSVHICKLLNIPSLVFYDTEHATLQNRLTIPFATYFFTPESFNKRCGSNHITYSGFHDLAYLHPKYYKPDPEIYQRLGLTPEDKFVIMRFVSWQAAHDAGQKGISLELKREIIKASSRFAKVYIVSETALDAEFEKYRLAIPPERIFDALYYATMYIGEGGSMATEAAILGTPAIFVSSLTAGVFDRLEKDFDLMYAFDPSQNKPVLEKIHTLAGQTQLKTTWRNKKERLLNESVDLTQFMINRILESGQTRGP